MKHKITFQNIVNFIEGNSRLFLNDLQPTHIKQQISYRMLLCKDDCAKTGHCIKCGCDYPGRIYTTESCNTDRFPDFMSRIDWEEFKKDKNIE